MSVGAVRLAAWLAAECVLVSLARDAAARTIRVTAAAGLDDAIRAARPGDNVMLAAGVYRGGVWIEAHGTPAQPITIRSERGLGSVAIEGGGETLNIGGGAHDLVFDGLELRNSGDNLLHIQDGAHHITVRNLSVHDAGDDGDGIKVNQAHDIVIDHVECFHPGRRPDRPDGNPAQECIDLLDVQRVVVQDCYLHDGGNMLLYAKGGSNDVVFQRNVIMGQGSDAIDPCVGLGAVTDLDLLHGRGYEVEHIVMRNNVVMRCGAGAIGLYDALDAWIVNNTLIDNGGQPIEFRAGNGARHQTRDAHIVNNIVSDDGGALRTIFALLSDGLVGLESHHNLYFNGTAPVPTRGEVNPRTEQGAIIADPAIHAPREAPRSMASAREMALTPIVAAIDHGAVIVGRGAVNDDLRGHTRPAGAAPDVGAIEVGGVPRAAAPLRWPSEFASPDRAGALGRHADRTATGLSGVVCAAGIAAWGVRRRH